LNQAHDLVDRVVVRKGVVAACTTVAALVAAADFLATPLFDFRNEPFVARFPY
jgi:hypothetical protein